MKAILDKIVEHNTDASVTFKIALRDLKEIPAECELTIKKWRPQRSRDALNYSWQIITQMANALQLDKEYLYKTLVCDFGELDRGEDGSIQKLLLKDTVDPLELDLYLHRTEHTTEIQGTRYRLYWVVKPPHEYDSQEFARFIDHIKQEAKDIGVDV